MMIMLILSRTMDHILFIAPTELTISAICRFMINAPSMNIPMSQTNTVAIGIIIDNTNTIIGLTAYKIAFSSDFAIPVRAVLAKVEAPDFTADALVNNELTHVAGSRVLTVPLTIVSPKILPVE